MTLSDELIRDRAYQLWLKAGSPTGQNRIHWDRAHAELERELCESLSLARLEVGRERPMRPDFALWREGYERDGPGGCRDRGAQKL
jgi:hypothetical protein